MPFESEGNMGTEANEVYDALDARRTGGGGYENAPATRMLATQCAVCRRPLVDAKSVELGIGPDCRRKYGFDENVSEQARQEANKIVHGIACEGGGLKVAEGTVRLRELGFLKLAAIIMKRACPVRIEQANDLLLVWAPFSDLATNLFRGISGRKWHGKDCQEQAQLRGRTCSCCAGLEPKERKFNSFPVAQKEPLFKALVRAYNGQVAMGPKGAFKIGAVA